jgi:CHAT domain-containing protein/tetratricopeptide (TPR) repeat protein
LRRPEIMAQIVLSTFAADHDPPLAATAAAAAVALAERLSDDHLRAQALEQRGILHQNRGDLAEARQDFSEAAEIWAARGVVLGELRDRLNVATLLVRSGSFEEARSRFAELRPEIERRGELRLLVGLAAGLGGAAANLGDSEAAIAELRGALRIADQLGEPRLEAQIRNDLGVLLRRLGESGAAIAELQAALDSFRLLGDRAWMARALNNLGFAYLSWGAAARARSAFEEALALRREAGDRAGEAATLKNLVRLALLENDPEAAQALVDQTLALDRELKNPRGAAASWRLAGHVRARRGDPAGARETFDLALAGSRQLGDRAGEAETLLSRGELLLALGDPAARADLEAAFGLTGALGDKAQLVSTQVALARLERAAGDRGAARRHLESAIAGIETLRTAIADPGQRAAFLASRARAYELLIAVLLELGPEFAEQALEVAEKGRARALLDWLEAPAASLDAGLPPALRERFRAARRQLNARSQRQVELLAAGKEADAAAALREVHAALEELEAARAAMAAASPAWADLEATDTLTTPQIRALLGPGDTLLEFALGEERSVLFEVDRDKVVAHPLPPRAALEELARQAARDLARLDLRTRTTRRENTAALAAALLGPVAASLGGKKRLVVIADGALHRLPFAALPLPDGRFLGEGRELAQPASASALAAQRARGRRAGAADGLLAIFADPVFEPNDPRLPPVAAGGAKDFLPGYGRLPGSRAEAEAILEAAPSGKILAAFGFDAKRDRFENGEAAGYRVLHLATHGVLEAERPELAGILLSQFTPEGRPHSGLLSLQDLLGLRFGADLAVLSGCSTALGEEISGEGLVGLARGFLYAGVPRVLASLWQVEDEATRRLMASFYRAYFAGRPAAAALAAAQAELRADPSYADPYHWGAFVLIGDGR